MAHRQNKLNNYETIWYSRIRRRHIWFIYCPFFVTTWSYRCCYWYRSKFLLSSIKVNQARLHNGLHYPRGQKTVNTILKYKERFIHDFGESINSQFKAYYAIANNESLTNKSEYEDFMNRNNIPYSEVDPNTLFNSNKVEALYLTKEYSYSYKIVLNKPTKPH